MNTPPDNEPLCQVIGCTPRPATVWFSDGRIFACIRCARELMDLEEPQGHPPMRLVLTTDVLKRGSHR